MENRKNAVHFRRVTIHRIFVFHGLRRCPQTGRNDIFPYAEFIYKTEFEPGERYFETRAIPVFP